MILSLFFSLHLLLVALASTCCKGSKKRGACSDEHVAGAVFVSTPDPLTKAEVSPGPVVSALDVLVLLTVAMSAVCSLSVCKM
jgi:hypothetical protein